VCRRTWSCRSPFTDINGAERRAFVSSESLQTAAKLLILRDGHPARFHMHVPMKKAHLYFLSLLTCTISHAVWAASATEPQLNVIQPQTMDILYEWQTEHCENWDVPDAPLRAFRNAANDVVVLPATTRAGCSWAAASCR
jgi:hypothetical protein